MLPGVFLGKISPGVGIVSSFPRKHGVSVKGLLVPKTREGYYHFKGGVEAAIKRSKIFAPYADLIWLETKEPNLEQAKAFARQIREAHPGKSVFNYEMQWMLMAWKGGLSTI